MKQFIIFASGAGSNAENIIKHFKQNTDVEVLMVLSNNKKAKVLEIAKKHDLSSFVFDRFAFENSTQVLDLLKTIKPDLIVLAGFLWKIPKLIVQAFQSKIINIHPALLPKYGGKGMYGINVHKAIIANKEKISGITIHYVNEFYDEGGIIFQAQTMVESNETPQSLSNKIKALEHTHYPKIIESLLTPDE